VFPSWLCDVRTISIFICSPVFFATRIAIESG
jgi:hypothetical protein